MNENELFRQMLDSFRPPIWVKKIIVVGDTAFASKDNTKKIMDLNKIDPIRCWWFVFAIAKTWRSEDGQFIKDIVT